MIRIYGENARGSYTQVTFGLLQACRHHGLLEGFVPTIASLDDQEFPGAEADVAICSGAPPQIETMHTDGVHKKRWYMLAANSEGVSERLVKEFRREHRISKRQTVDGLLTPSQWSRESILRSIPEIPVVVIPHGVNDICRPSDAAVSELRNLYDDGRFFVLHVTSTATKRKGTLELIQAWEAMGEVWWAKTRLVILAHPLTVSVYQRYVERLGMSQLQVVVAAGLGLSDEDMVNVYHSAHIVCQPSRAEGFGLCPLESRACGVPVVATICTGHSEHMDASAPGVVVIPHHDSGEIDDYHGATAPTIEVGDIMVALLRARANWRELKAAALANAQSVREQWAWERVCEAPLKALVEEGAAL